MSSGLRKRGEASAGKPAEDEDGWVRVDRRDARPGGLSGDIDGDRTGYR